MVEVILENVSDEKKDILEFKCMRSQTALHFATRCKQKDMAQQLIKKHSKHLKSIQHRAETTPKERQLEGNSKNVKDDIQLVTLANENADKNIGELSLVHWAAWYGDNFDISTKTRSGLNMLDIACMINELKGDIEFYKHLLDNNLDNFFPTKTD